MIIISELGLVGYDACFTRRRSRVRFSELVLSIIIIIIIIMKVALLVQWLEFAVANGEARVRFSDSAAIEIFFAVNSPVEIDKHDWRSWQRVGLIILRSWVRSPHCAL